MAERLIGWVLPPKSLAGGDAAGGAPGGLSLASAVKFSQGLETLDQGDLKGASTQLAAVVRDSPDFPLARTRYSQLLKRLREAGK